MSLELYLFSILDNISNAFAMIGFIFVFIFVICMIIGVITWIIDRNIALAKKFLSGAAVSLPILLLAIFLNMLMPTQDSLVKSYLILEGKDIVTSENIETIFKKLDEKSDKIINKIGD